MRPKYLITILVLLALAVPASPAHAGGVVSICDEAHLLEALAGGGTVTFTCNGTITLTATITIAADTTIDGSGQTVTISGTHAVRVFKVNFGVTLNLNKLTVANGSTAFDYGGGIYNDGALSVSNSTFSGNSAYNGGGIYNEDYGMLIVSNSIFSGNSASFGDGGGILNGGTLIVSNSTFSGNNANTSGGGIYNEEYGTLSVSNSTFSDNNAGYNGNGGGTVTLKNSIVARSHAGRNCFGAITDGGGNLSYPDTTCPGINSDPLLGPLQINGGPTRTMEPGPGSAALDAASDATCTAAPVNNLDQRGIVRPQGPHCDIGAVERLPFRIWFALMNSQ